MLDTVILLPDGSALEGHNPNDVLVWGLLDVALGRRKPYPETIYRVSGDSTSGVVGVLNPDGTLLVKARTNIGRTFTILAVAEEPTVATTVWDGAAPPATFEHEDGTPGTEHTKGVLLGDIQIDRPNMVPKTHRKRPPSEGRGFASAPGVLTWDHSPVLRRRTE